MAAPLTATALAETLLHGQGPARRRALAKSITLVESTRDDHRTQADALLDAVMPATGRAWRLGISGVPGVGKSTFIETLGLYLVERGHHVAVLAVDPSSSLSGGSILGDKTRMEKLSVDERAFIRPSPSAGTLGGVAEKTREALLLCEAAGHDIVIVETVGVGQSETAVAAMTDGFVLLQLPNAGDDLQAIKKGVMEIADLVVINKADIDPTAAMRARAQITSALRLVGGVQAIAHAHEHAHALAHAHDPSHTSAGPWQPRVMQLSAITGAGLDEFWTTVVAFRDQQQASGALVERRHRQDQAWMWERIASGLQQRFRHHAAVRAALPATTEAVRTGHLAPSRAARGLLALLDAPPPADPQELSP
jgi:LAO/AO transport system kinase